VAEYPDNDELPVETNPVPPGDNLMCHRSMERVCGPDCIAFLVTPSKEHIGQPWARCLELVNGYREAKHVNIIALELIRWNKREDAREADAHRRLPMVPR